MSLTDIETRIIATRDAATDARTKFTEAKERITGDRTLSDEYKRELVTAEHQRTNTLIAGLQDRELAIIAERRQQVERKLAGTIGTSPDAVIAFRDAQDRADAIDEPIEALRILERALLTGDKSLADAVAQRAFSMGWRDATDLYTKEHPQKSQDLDDRAQLVRLVEDITYVVGRGFIYAPVSM